jgi:hypothetical protein
MVAVELLDAHLPQGGEQGTQGIERGSLAGAEVLVVTTAGAVLLKHDELHPLRRF